MKYLLVIVMCLGVFGCVPVSSEKTLEKKKPSILGFECSWFAPKEKEDDRTPKEKAEDKLVERGYDQLSKGIGVAIIGFCLSAFMVNPVVQKFAEAAFIGGAVWGLIGLTKIFVASILTYLLWALGIIVAIGVLIWVRNKGVDNWIKEKWNGKIQQNNRNMYVSPRWNNTAARRTGIRPRKWNVNKRS